MAARRRRSVARLLVSSVSGQPGGGSTGSASLGRGISIDDTTFGNCHSFLCGDGIAIETGYDVPAPFLDTPVFRLCSE